MVASQQKVVGNRDPVCVCGHGRSLHVEPKGRGKGPLQAPSLCQACNELCRAEQRTSATSCTGFVEQ